MKSGSGTSERRPTPAADERLATFVAFFQNAPVAMLLLDEDGQVREMNHAAEETFGSSAAQIRGHQLGDAISCATSSDSPGTCGLEPPCET